MTYDDIARRLGVFVAQLVGDVRFRRRLRYYPAQALAEHGLPAADAPLELPVRHWTIEVSIDLPHLCGGVAAPKATRPPLAARLVALGARPLALVHGPEAELVALRRWGEDHGLVGLLTPWQLAVRADAGKGGFSNLAAEVPAVAGSGGQRGLLLAADAAQAMLGWLSLLCRWDAFLGRLLGYPACCADAFATRWNEARDHHQGDVAGLVAKTGGSGPFPWPLNPFLRYGGLELVPHFPCRYDCPESLALARRLLAALELAEPEHAAALRRDLPALVLYTETGGVFASREAELRPLAGEEGRVEVVTAPAAVVATDRESPLARAWADGGAVTVAGGEVKVGEVTTGGWLVDFRGEAPGFGPPADSGDVAVATADAALAAWLAAGSGVVEPAAGARLLDFARLVTTARLRQEVAGLRSRVAALPGPPRDAGRFAAGVAGHFAATALMTLPAVLPLGRTALALGEAEAAGDPGAPLRAAGWLAGALAGRLDPGAGVVLPREAFGGPGATLDLCGAHAVVAAAGGPVALRGPDDLSPGGDGAVVTWLDGVAARFVEPPSAAVHAAGAARLQGGVRVDGWPVLAATGPQGREAAGAGGAGEPGGDAGLDALAPAGPGSTAEAGWRVAVLRGEPDGGHGGGAGAGGLAPGLSGDAVDALRDGLALAGSLCPAWLQAAQRSVEALAVVSPGAAPPPLPDVLAFAAGALAPSGDPAAWLAGVTAPAGERALPQPLAAALALAAAEGRRRAVLAWPLLARGGDAALPELWREGHASALATATAALDAWRLLAATAERLLERSPGEPLPGALVAWLGALAECEWPAERELAAEVRPAAAAPLAAEIAQAVGALRRLGRAVAERAQRAGAGGSPGTGGEESPAATLAVAPAAIAAARERFARDGVCELPVPVLAAAAFAELAAESVEQARHAWASDRASPPQSCWRAELGPVAARATAALQPVVEAITGARLALSRAASCYTYYVGPGSFGGRHQDRAGACTVTCLVYLHAEASAGPPSAGMTLLVWRAGEPASAAPFATVPTAPNLGVVLLGSRLPHERPQLAAGESVSLLALCFGVAGEGAA